MTDNEILTALECCVKGKQQYCNECPIREHDDCVGALLGDALFIINRQKAQTEALQMDNEQLRLDGTNANMNCEHLAREVERLRGWRDLLKAEKHSLIKSEAIKKFAEELKHNGVRYRGLLGEPIYEYTESDIDNLVKKMKEKE